MKIATQNQAFFPTAIMEKFEYIKAMGSKPPTCRSRRLVADTMAGSGISLKNAA